MCDSDEDEFLSASEGEFDEDDVSKDVKKEEKPAPVQKVSVNCCFNFIFHLSARLSVFGAYLDECVAKFVYLLGKIDFFRNIF